MWDSTSQTYLNGVVPSNHESSADIDALLALNGDGKLKIFGYGSLCWHAGSEGGVLSLANRGEKEEEDGQQQQQHKQDQVWTDDECTHDIERNNTTVACPTVSNSSLSEIKENTSTLTTSTLMTETTQQKGKVVTTSPGLAIGYQRCWSQRSADHRGTPEFNGIVCTLLSDEELDTLEEEERQIQCAQRLERHLLLQPDCIGKRKRVSMTEGLIYTIDGDLARECLEELDFREKGGYARDIIDVVEIVAKNRSAAAHTTASTVASMRTKALLYRGTPENPAFWKRVLFDLPLAAAIMSLAAGPSGSNDIYLRRLHAFLLSATTCQRASITNGDNESRDIRTGELAKMMALLQSDYRPYIIFGAGSNEHNQLLLKSNKGIEDDHEGMNDKQDEPIVRSASDNVPNVTFSRQEVHEWTEILLVVPRSFNDTIDHKLNTNNKDLSLTLNSSAQKTSSDHHPLSLHAGGGHSALLTNGGDLYLWGMNDFGQLGRPQTTNLKTHPFPNIIPPLLDIRVAEVALGHSHTLIIEKHTGHLFGFGEDTRGQVSGCRYKVEGHVTINHYLPTRIGKGSFERERFIYVAAGLFHSAAITDGGVLLTWGCGRFGQCIRVDETARHRDIAKDSSTVGRWQPADGCKLVQVACGRRHTTVLDERGRVWTFGENKYGQLGRDWLSTKPQLVHGPLGQDDSGCFAIFSGWSHNLALTRNRDGRDQYTLYGWGRNDKGQLGLDQNVIVKIPRVLEPLLIGPECTSLHKDGQIRNSVRNACCGAESSHILDSYGNIYSSGWNEHGNLAIGQSDDGHSDHHVSPKWTETKGAAVVTASSSFNSGRLVTIFAAGGAHVMTTLTERRLA